MTPIFAALATATVDVTALFGVKNIGFFEINSVSAQTRGG